MQDTVQTAASVVLQFPTSQGATVSVFAGKEPASRPFRWMCSAGDAASTEPYASLPFARDDAKAHADACQASQPTGVAEPRTWTFIDRRTGEPVSYTCMVGCTLDHRHEMGRTVFREDVWCWFWDDSMTLPVNENGHPEEFRVLSTVIKVEPWSPNIADRLPFAVIELVDDHFIDGLDPDGLETVINTFAARLERMRQTHRRLVEVREQYRQRAAHTAPNTWQSLTRDDLVSRPIASLLKAFGVGVVEADVESVALLGEPGSMELHVLPDVPQCLREDLARRALLAWFDARNGGAA